MKVLIAGGAGFIGSNLASYHLDRDDEVYIIDNYITGQVKNIELLNIGSSVHFLEGDIVNFDFSGVPCVDIIYHLASPASPIQYKKYPVETLMTNALGTKNLLDFMQKSESKSFVLASTSEVYGDPLVHPQKEDYWGNVNPNGVRSCYDEGKRFAESLSKTYQRKYNLNIRIARIFNTYGPNMEQLDGRVISNFIMQALRNNPITIYGDGTQTRSFCYVSDLVSGLYLLATTKNIEGEVINLGNPNELTIKDMAEMVKTMTHSQSQIVFEPIDEDDPKKRKPDIEKALKLLHWKPSVNLEDGLAKTIQYFKTRFIDN